MRYEEFVGRIQAKAGLDDRESAERVTQATLETLVEYLPEDLALHLAVRLPREVAEHLRRRMSGGGSSDATRLDPQTFIQRIAERAGLGENDAAVYANLVLDVVREIDGSGRRTACGSLPENTASLIWLSQPGSTAWVHRPAGGP